MSHKKVSISLAHCANATTVRGAGRMSIDSPAFRNLVGMERFSGADRALCVREFYKNNDSATVAQRKFCSHRGLRNIKDAPSVPLIRKWVKKFEETGSTMDKRKSGRPRSSRSDENVEMVNQSIRDNPDLSVRKRAHALNVPRSSLHRILRKDLKLHPYKIQLVQELKPQDAGQRLQFVNQVTARFATFNNILFSDEAHFHLNGHVNKQNCRYWSATNPKHKHQKPLHSPKVTVWAAMSARGIIGPYFFEDGRGCAVTVNSERYVEMLDNFLVPELQNFAGYNQRTWFQQDGATSHTSNTSLPRVREIFPNKLISRRGDINWPPRSPDLSPMDFFLWGYLKSKVYVNKPGSLVQLKENIRHEMAAITEIMCRAVLRNFAVRLDECREREGLHLDDIIFKT